MQNFTFQSPTKFIFGKETELKVGKEVKHHGKKILLHYGGGSIKKSGLYDRVVKALKDENIDFVELSGVQPNPRLSLVKEGIELCRREKVDFILAVGGGSVIDSAKAIAVGVHYDGDVWDFFEGKSKIGTIIPIGVVLTLPATGSEASSGTVITNEEGWYKKSCGHNLMRPRFAIMNPELTYSLPPYQTASGVADIMAHVMERYFTNEKNVDFTDRLCEATLKSMIKNLPIALKNPRDYAARAEIMWAGTIAHNGLLGTGREEDWASHNIEHELSGIYDVTHGAGLAVIFPAWIKYVYKNNMSIFAQFASRVWEVEPDFDHLEVTIETAIEKMKDFFRAAGLPVTLEELNIPDDRLEEMAEKCTENGPVGSLVKLYKEDVLNIYHLAKK
ncbi:iron-containing alcohol dehydrogenase [Irregularibacter muris]|uniref:Iron-containing alcohol dehydrogenase n=1 Tax=Irregularibacter muris TaxID=1796619 RepID=A0AAE3HG74_9FIRM|nr:iron-containing alcohol dehydrogenase [Irregularibacter muris]MCR1899997.1 iron-containing alcohol dehydrogenase [Irregularibacter muris]